MVDQPVYLQPAYILQKRPYRESSFILDILTRDYGRIPVLARGVKKAKSKTTGILQPFHRLLISYTGKAELKLLTGSEIDQRLNLKGISFYCGYYINELLVFFLHTHDPHPEVFESYQNTLQALIDPTEIQPLLRLFEIQLLAYSGYALPLQYDVRDCLIDPNKKYFYNPEQGAIENDNGLFSGATLQALYQQSFTDSKQLAEAKLLLRSVIDYYLQGRSLKSRSVINQIIQQTSI